MPRTVAFRAPARLCAAATQLRPRGARENRANTKKSLPAMARRDSYGALERIRTFDLPLRRRTLYPLSYEGLFRNRC